MRYVLHGNRLKCLPLTGSVTVRFSLGDYDSPLPLTATSESGAGTNFSGCSFCNSM
jgi:hypothetical protein